MNRLPELLSNTVLAFPLPIAFLIIVLGIVCITAGKKFYWLATGLNAFMATYIMVSTIMAWPAWQYLMVAAIGGLLVALLTIVIRQISFSLNAFFIFGLFVLILFIQLLSFETNSFTPVVIFFVAGSLAAFYNLAKPPAALVYTTAFIGALAISSGIFRLLHRAFNPLYITVLWAILGIAGSVWQTHQAEKRNGERE